MSLFVRRMTKFFLVTGIVLGSFEAILRLLAFSYPPISLPITMDLREIEREAGPESLHVRDHQQFWVPRPSAVIQPDSDERINEDGFRGPPLNPRGAGAIRIAVMGESTTFGHKVSYADSYAARLGDRLSGSSQKPIEILSAGVIGHTALQGLQRYRHSVRDYAPAIVTLAFGTTNDHLGAALSDRQKLDANEFRETWIYRAFEALRNGSRCAQALAYLVDQAKGGRKEIFRNMHQQLKATRQSFRNAGDVDWPGKRRVAPTEFEQFIRTLIAEIRDDNAKPILISLPRLPRRERERPVLVVYSEILGKIAEEAGVPWLDGRRLFHQHTQGDEEAMLELFAGDPVHLSVKGHNLIAEELARLILEDPP